MNHEVRHEDVAQAVLQPALDLFSGSDGGVSFSRLRHGFLPDMIKLAEDGDQQAQEFVKMVTQFSRLCTAMNKN